MERDKGFWFRQGQTLFDAEDYEAALVAYKRAIQLGFDDAVVYYNIAAGLYNIAKNPAQYEEALTAIKEAILRYPYKTNQSNAYVLKAKILRRLKRLAEAKNACDQALLLNPSNANARSLSITLDYGPLMLDQMTEFFKKYQK